MIYEIYDLDSGAWGGQFLTPEDAADAANQIIKSAVTRRQKRRLAIVGGTKNFVEYTTTGEAWYT